MTMNPTPSTPRPSRSAWLLAALAFGLAACLHPPLALAQDADPSDKPEASSKDDGSGPAARKAESKPSSKADASQADAKADDDLEPKHVYKTNEEWRKLLTYEQFLVTRMGATEPAFSGKDAHGHPKGTFLCVCCGAKLFDADHKFESGTGWPSFWRPIKLQALNQAIDRSEYEPRVEVTCARCGAHLGHVFEDGPPPTGLRFCINSLSLKLDSEPAKPTTSRKTSSNGVRRRSAPAKKATARSAKSGSSSQAEKADAPS
jgi:peptide-methionine (R)-S-oxide reductase